MELRDKDGLTEQEFLARYNPGSYERPSVAADMVIFTVSDAEEENYRKLPQKQLRVLLIKRGGHPFLGKWALPGGFVRPEETAEQAAQRELGEETGVENVYLEQLYTFSQPDRDPRMRVISCAYMALVDSSKLTLSAGDDAQEARWFNVSFRLEREQRESTPEGFTRTRQYRLTLTSGEIVLSALTEVSSQTGCRVLEPGGLAFDHGMILTYAMERLRGKIEYTDIALHLMPKLFTLTQLQQVYEVILGRELLKAAFRRKVAGLVEETDHFEETSDNGGHRPSKLYRRQEME